MALFSLLTSSQASGGSGLVLGGAVPEPASIGLVLFAAGCFGLSRRRSRG